jgi:hypothetical protein
MGFAPSAFLRSTPDGPTAGRLSKRSQGVAAERTRLAQLFGTDAEKDCRPGAGDGSFSSVEFHEKAFR